MYANNAGTLTFLAVQLSILSISIALSEPASMMNEFDLIKNRLLWEKWIMFLVAVGWGSCSRKVETVDVLRQQFSPTYIILQLYH